MTLANEGTSGRPLTNEDVANKPRRITRAQHSTHGDVRSKPRRTTKSIKMTSRTKHHDSNEYEKALRLMYTVNSQASIGFVDNR